MTFLPIVARELRLKARRPRTYGFRCGMVLAFAVISFGILAVDWSAGQNPTVMGQHLFWTLSGLAFACALLAGPAVAADCLCDEKREGTLGLLFLTNLKGHDVVLGKLFATSLLVATGLLIADCYTLCWVGLWKGLTATHSTRAFAESISRVLILPWFAFFGALGIWCAFSGLGDVPDPGWLVCLWFVIGYPMDFAFCLWGIHK